jgi:hypothetical protein
MWEGPSATFWLCRLLWLLPSILYTKYIKWTHNGDVAVFSSLQNESSEPQKTSGSVCCLLHDDFLLGLFFDPEDVLDIFL